MSETCKLSVCPHDTAKRAAEWFQFNAYLQQKLGCALQFRPEDDFLTERSNVLGGGFQIVYANPLSAWTFQQRLGFIPVAKAAGVYDEVVLVARTGVAGIPAERPLRVATASDEYLIHILGLKLLDRLHIAREDCVFLRQDSWMKTVHCLLRGEADLGFIFNDAWQTMATSTRKQLEALAESADHLAFHCFCIAPEWADRKASLQAALLAMNTDPKGQAILDALQFGAIESLDANALEPLRDLLAAHPGAK